MKFTLAILAAAVQAGEAPSWTQSLIDGFANIKDDPVYASPSYVPTRPGAPGYVPETPTNHYMPTNGLATDLADLGKDFYTPAVPTAPHDEVEAGAAAGAAAGAEAGAAAGAEAGAAAAAATGPSSHHGTATDAATEEYEDLCLIDPELPSCQEPERHKPTAPSTPSKPTYGTTEAPAETETETAPEPAPTAVQEHFYNPFHYHPHPHTHHEEPEETPEETPVVYGHTHDGTPVDESGSGPWWNSDHQHGHFHSVYDNQIIALAKDFQAGKKKLQDAIKKATQIDLTQGFMEQIVENATKAQEECSDKIAAAKETIEADLKTKTEALKSQIVQNNLDDLEAVYQSLIDGVKCQQVEMDYFSVVDQDSPIEAGIQNLSAPFCVSAGKTFEFRMQLTARDEVEDVYLKLYKDDVMVAQSGMDDAQEPSSLSLLYVETLAADSEFRVELTSRVADTVPALGAQMAFKLYGDCYPTATTTVPPCETE